MLSNVEKIKVVPVPVEHLKDLAELVFNMGVITVGALIPEEGISVRNTVEGSIRTVKNIMPSHSFWTAEPKAQAARQFKKILFDLSELQARILSDKEQMLSNDVEKADGMERLAGIVKIDKTLQPQITLYFEQLANYPTMNYQTVTAEEVESLEKHYLDLETHHASTKQLHDSIMECCKRHIREDDIHNKEVEGKVNHFVGK